MRTERIDDNLEPDRSNQNTPAKFIKHRNSNPVPENKPFTIKPLSVSMEAKKVEKGASAAPSSETISRKRLEEAIIWNEILGKPVSKRRKSRLR
jgi:hypothetical protein